MTGDVDINAIDWHSQAPNAAAVAIGRVLAMLGSVVGLRLLTEFVPPATFGRYKLALAGISLITGILVRPFSQYAMRAWHDGSANDSQRRFVEQYGRSFRYFVGAVGLVVAASALVTKGSGWFGPVDLVPASAVLILQALVDYERSILVTRARMREVALIDTATRWLVPTAISLSIAIGESLAMILSVHACTLACVLLAPRLRQSLRVAPRGPARSGGIDFSDTWRFAYPLMISGCLNWILHESDRFMLGIFHDSHAVAIYAAAYGLASAPFLVVGGAVIQLITPLAFGASSRSGTALVSRSALSLMLIVCSLGVFLFWLVGDLVAQLALAESYREAALDLLIWIAIGYACLSVAMCFDLAAYGSKRTRYVAAATGAAAATNVSLNLLLVPDHGAAGAAWATSAALAAYLLCMVVLVGRGRPAERSQPLGASAADRNLSSR